MRSVSALLVFTIAVAMLSCKKDSNPLPPAAPPNLTGKLWQLDTVLINAPVTYNTLTDEQKYNYNVSLAFTKDKAQLTFVKDGSVNCSGDWDFGYTNWQLINNNSDIKVNRGSTGADTLRAWQASATQFSYVHALGNDPFDCTFIYK